jgi:hypothetical protein
VVEFKIEDIVYRENIPSAVTENGEGVPLTKVWIRRGAHGVIMEPFEVGEPVNFVNKTKELRERFLKVHNAR